MAKSSRKKAAERAADTRGSNSGALRTRDDARQPPGPPAQGTRVVEYTVAGIVSVITFAVYLFSLRHEFVNWDDDLYVLNNPFIRSVTPSFFRWAFFDFYASNWHPLTWLSHALDYTLWGLNPFGHHLTNIILHALNTFLVAMLAVRLAEAWKTRQAGTGHSGFPDGRAILITAGVTSLLFGIHPAHVESAAWVAERKDLLCALFFLLSIMSYLSYVFQRTYKTYFLSLVFFILALLSKPMAVSLPLVLLIVDWHPLGRIQSVKALWSAAAEKIPFIALSLVSSLLTVLAQKTGGAMSMMETVPLPSRVLVAARALMAYLGKMVVPVNLVPYYPYPKEASLFSAEYLPAVFLALGTTAACVLVARKQKLLPAAWAYYVVTLIPVIGIIQVGGQAMADRYTYLPSLGPFLVMGLAASWVSSKARDAKAWGPAFRLGTAVTAVLAFAFLIFLTVNQIGVWKNSLTLWNAVIEKQPRSVPHAYTNRGLAYMNMGRFDEAVEDYNTAIALNPSDYNAYADRGLAFERMGRLDMAMEDMNRAIALNPGFSQFQNDRRRVHEKMQRQDKGGGDAVPDIAEDDYSRGVAYGEAGLLDKSIESFNKALQRDPKNVDAYVSRGISYARSGARDRAMQDFNTAIRINRNHAQAYFNRGNLYSIMGQQESALSDFRQACALGDQGGCNVLQRYAK